MPLFPNLNAECLDKPNNTTIIQQIGLLYSAQFYVTMNTYCCMEIVKVFFRKNWNGN
jgi:hypothetical protein